ncbi:MAG: 2-dehydro-3-deoxyphosphooctonate aldolase [Candidatus Electrothrix sp. GM3_4]|nr:2-dehydro-3-deoxyphosphooctonate aldolase [Candidatus Electrothrix sp. GM3_4]
MNALQQPMPRLRQKKMLFRNSEIFPPARRTVLRSAGEFTMRTMTGHLTRYSRYTFLALCAAWITFLLPPPSTAAQLNQQDTLPTTAKADRLMTQAEPRVKRELARKGMRLGQPVFMRIFKLSKQLELWMYNRGNFRRFKTYPICSYSGYVGPKLAEGDWQSPEGFYTVSAEQMNPKSRFHLSFNIGYPNRYDSEKSYTGSAIMVHGNCVSQGCFAMGNKQIEEIYLLAYQAFLQGQEQFSIHIFPFRMTRDNLVKYRSSPWYDFWSNLAAGYNAFEQTRQVPTISTARGRYVFEDEKNEWVRKRWVLIQKKKSLQKNLQENQHQGR